MSKQSDDAKKFLKMYDALNINGGEDVLSSSSSQFRSTYEQAMRSVCQNTEDEGFFERQIRSEQRAKLQFRKYLEFNCKSNLSDELLLKIQIDIALMNRDEKLFMRLTNELNSRMSC